MNKQQVINLLYTIYNAGFNHGGNEGVFPEHGTFEAFNRLIIGESPTLDGCYYAIKEKVDTLIDKSGTNFLYATFMNDGWEEKWFILCHPSGTPITDEAEAKKYLAETYPNQYWGFSDHSSMILKNAMQDNF